MYLRLRLIFLFLISLTCLIQENVSKKDISALNLTTDIDEYQVLTTILSYLLENLEVSLIFPIVLNGVYIDAYL